MSGWVDDRVHALMGAAQFDSAARRMFRAAIQLVHYNTDPVDYRDEVAFLLRASNLLIECRDCGADRLLFTDTRCAHCGDIPDHVDDDEEDE